MVAVLEIYPYDPSSKDVDMPKSTIHIAFRISKHNACFILIQDIVAVQHLHWTFQHDP